MKHSPNLQTVCTPYAISYNVNDLVRADVLEEHELHILFNFCQPDSENFALELSVDMLHDYQEWGIGSAEFRSILEKVLVACLGTDYSGFIKDDFENILLSGWL